VHIYQAKGRAMLKLKDHQEKHKDTFPEAWGTEYQRRALAANLFVYVDRL